MSQQFEAIYENGVLRLITPIVLPESTRVSGVVHEKQQDQLPDAELVRRQQEALNAMFEEIHKLPQTPATDGLSNRDHDFILYGWKK
ncbi:MAG: hypothetical protein DCC67_03345 [Planctomycetota bacterium]|nr:MAG: hypothetical protein DCC67_03345 [Planctomycetota bacterium]